MNRSEAAKILTKASAFDGRDPNSEAAATAWAEALEDVPADADAFAAVSRFYSDSTGTDPGARRWLEPHQLRTIRRKIRAERLAANTVVYDGNPDETASEYLTNHREQIANVASGFASAQPALKALGSRPAPAVQADLSEDDIRALRQQNDLAAMLRDALARASEENGERRRIVLARPEIAERLTQPPASFARPDCWSGYVAPDRLPDGQPNRSPVRAQIAEILAAAQQAA